MIKRILLLFVIIAFLFSGCGDDDPIKPPDNDPSGISALNGFYYKGVMGSSTLDKPLAFVVRDGEGVPIPDKWVHFQRIVGDGSFANDSLKTNAAGNAIAEYTFDGSLGHAEILAFVRGVDSVLVTVRASTLITGVFGQGQYILFEDRYSDVKNFNGNTVVDTFLTHQIMYVNYETALGVVVMLWDDSLLYTPNDTSDVFGVIVNTKYDKKILDSIGIGSTYQGMVDLFGQPDTLIEDLSSPAAWRIRYLSLGLTIYANPLDTIINEIHMIENVVTKKMSVGKEQAESSKSNSLNKSYRLFK